MGNSLSPEPLALIPNPLGYSFSSIVEVSTRGRDHGPVVASARRDAWMAADAAAGGVQ